MRLSPDVVVLSAGGGAAARWISGVLAGIEDHSAFALRRCECLVGTSAGAIIAARIASGKPLPRPEHADHVEPATSASAAAASAAATSAAAHDGVPSMGAALAAPLAAVGLRLAQRPGARARAGALRLIAARRSAQAAANDRASASTAAQAANTANTALEPDPGLELEACAWDGRLRVVALERATGRRVVFGAPGGPNGTVAQAVRASCAAPWRAMSAPVWIDGIEYVDGSLWSPANLDVAPVGSGTRVLCLCAVGARQRPLPSALRSVLTAGVLLEAAALRAHGAHVEIVTPDRRSEQALASGLGEAERLQRAHAAGYGQGARL